MRLSRLAWYAIVVAVIVGLFAPTMVARAGDPGTTETLKGCPWVITR